MKTVGRAAVCVAKLKVAGPSDLTIPQRDGFFVIDRNVREQRLKIVRPADGRLPFLRRLVPHHD
ncbi:hypothetical protein ABTD90_19230, partial [Acinetobacter baumannii]